jgi:hypothetical protein
MEHYVVINDWSVDGDCGIRFIGVTHTLEDAKRLLNEVVADERDFANDNHFMIYEDNDTVFDAGIEGYYSANHTSIFIKCVYGG